MKKNNKNIWEIFFTYPSFDKRFKVAISIILIIFITISLFMIFGTDNFKGPQDIVALANLMVQSATLVIGILAAYYALRQLLENKLTPLDEAGHRELREKNYSRAFDKWKEAFQIKQDVDAFNNSSEALLLSGDYKTFDQYMKIPDSKAFLKKETFKDPADQMTILYLKAVRHLLEENQGLAKAYIQKIIQLAQERGSSSINWNFQDLQSSKNYLSLAVEGDCKHIIDNLIAYLSKEVSSTPMSDSRKESFEAGNYATQVA